MTKDKNRLQSYFEKNDGRLIHKWNHYFDIYEKHFKRYIDKEVVVLEIGVFHGGSLQMWQDYFGPKAKIYGVDVNPRCKELEKDNIEILIGSQSDRAFLQKLKTQLPKIDILIDDGGHTMKQQVVSFQELYDHVKDDGVYLCEDVHTSYESSYGGGYLRRGTFIEHSKKLIDALNAFHSEQRSLKVSEFTKFTDSIHFYDSVVVFEKKFKSKPVDLKSGTPFFDSDEPDKNSRQKLAEKTRKCLHSVLSLLRLPYYFK